MKPATLTALFTVACLAVSVPAAARDTARDMYNRALAQERVVRDEASKPTRVQMRRAIAAYEAVVRVHPGSGYCDNALWQAANLATLAFERFGDDADRKTATRLFALLAREYPTSRLAAEAKRAAEKGWLPPAVPATSTTAAADSSSQKRAGTPDPPPAAAVPSPGWLAPKVPATSASGGVAVLKDVKRSELPDGIRLSVELDAEVPYYQEEIGNPRRLFFDLKGVKAAPNLQDVSLKFDGDLVKEVRLGRHPQNTTRVVVDIEGVSGYSVYPLYGPYRLVIDLRRPVATNTVAPKAVPPPIAVPPPVPSSRAVVPLTSLPEVKQTLPDTKPVAPPPAPLPSKSSASTALPPAAPASNSNGKFSLSRQLGLSVSRVVIDAGHGGHDPGAHGNGINESELTLDVALRLQKLLLAQPGIDVVMTRDTDVFIPLEERTAIANREGADLFLSIHANASRNPQARGIETYFLNFAMNPEAEAVAARENATSGQPMHNLPDIVKAIALNNKINESRDLAVTVQKSMAKRLGARNRSLRDLGVKQAPFVVLIGAVMPSVLAEISFVTNKQDGALLKTNAYRQQIAQSLFDAIVNYQQSLKRMNAVAGKKATEQ
jgi:N-acetylmuramoyl-L-alanine amidase